MIMSTPDGSKLTAKEIGEKLNVSRQTIHAYLAELRTGSPAGKKSQRAHPSEEESRKKAFTVLTRLETNFGLDAFRDFVASLDGDKRAKLRAMLDGAVQ